MPDGQPPYTPKFSDNDRGPYVTVKRGLASSYNQISAWIMKQIDPVTVIELAKQMGVKSFIEPVPSICVGAAEVTLAEMVGAYTTFANKGIYTEPIFVTRIEDKNGNTIATFKAGKEQAMSEETAWVMLQMLRGVIQGGTSTRMYTTYKLNNEIAGKTGTTNENSDGWFIGMTPSLVSGAWVGGEIRSIHFDRTALGQGANMALPIWALYMQKVYANAKLGYTMDEKFIAPEQSIDIILNCNEYDGNDPSYENEYRDTDFF
jgi:penicillin-binding protein 1A